MYLFVSRSIVILCLDVASTSGNMPCCVVSGCNSQSGTAKVHVRSHVLHRVPEDHDLQILWLKVCRPKNRLNFRYTRECGQHFADDDNMRDLRFELLNPSKTVAENKNRRLKRSAVPSRHISGTNDPRYVSV